jgi:predicted AlkP superfamily pyrophosphatase or phosphodiesterase
MRRTIVINAVGLTSPLLRQMPTLRSFSSSRRSVPIRPVFPAVTCTAQTTYLTGVLPEQHGIVGNGWHFPDVRETRFWHQSARLPLVPRLWSRIKDREPRFTSANCFWWYAMHSDADVTLTPRPVYCADGRKLPDLWTNPASLRDELQSKLGPFPLFNFWGPTADIRSTRWIVDASIDVAKKFEPTLQLVYLPHLDYDLQRFGPESPQATKAAGELDREIGRLIDFAEGCKISVLVLSEYGITPASKPIHLNRVLRNAGLLSIRTEAGREMLDAGASAAFAVADHQVAHVYVNQYSKLAEVEALCRSTPGVEQVWVGPGRGDAGLNHSRAGDIVVSAVPEAWFTYYFWLEDARAPDFARTVDIHRKPGYDPCELFIDPAIRFPKLAIGSRLMKRKFGMRTLLDVIPLDATLIRGSHGHRPLKSDEWPVAVGDADLIDKHRGHRKHVDALDVCSLIESHVMSPA